MFTLSAGIPLHLVSYPSPAVQAFTNRNLTYGSQGNDVYELQHRLDYIGFYRGKVDGYFGWKTYWAVRKFQSQFGIPVTGRVNMETKTKLVKSTAAWHYVSSRSIAHDHSNPSYKVSEVRHHASTSAQMQRSLPRVPGVTQSDMRLMAHVVYGEARGEPFNGEVAIAAVILNRLRDPRFPHSIPAIVYQPGAFTCTSDGQVNLQPDAKAMKAVVDALHGWDPSHGAVYYFNPVTATSKWIWSRPVICKIGKHIFCR